MTRVAVIALLLLTACVESQVRPNLHYVADGDRWAVPGTYVGDAGMIWVPPSEALVHPYARYHPYYGPPVGPYGDDPAYYGASISRYDSPRGWHQDSIE